LTNDSKSYINNHTGDNGMKIQIKKQLKCKRCGYEWNPRKTDVRVCPKCHSPYWDKPTVNIKGEQAKKGKIN
jgi:predicted Zn-ribbon and HTH transcriptional regulator